MSRDSNGTMPLPYSRTCFVCGDENHAGLQTRFYIDGPFVKARLKPAAHHCGYENVVHGGIVAAILDECMGWAGARAIGHMCVTAELTVRYLQNVPGDVELTVETEVMRFNRRLAVCRGRIVDEQGREYARAEGKFTPLTPEQTLAVDRQLVYDPGQESLFNHLEETG